MIYKDNTVQIVGYMPRVFLQQGTRGTLFTKFLDLKPVVTHTFLINKQQGRKISP